jgi:4-aminobutyrate aminotransferase/(S)-3-amino-2-methylpropionate transaminase
MTMTSKKAYSYGLGPFPDGVYRAEFPYLYRKPSGMTDEEAIQYYIRRFKSVFEEASPAEYVAAVVVEPIQGEGGFIPAPIEWVKAVRKICDQHGILLVADEVQSGFGRSGQMFVSDYWKEAGCAPDLITFAKSVAAGVPLSGVTGDAEVMDRVRSGIVGGTFNGNALACAAALKVIEIMRRDRLPDRALEIGKKVAGTYMKWKTKYPVVGDVRGIGAMIGIEFVKDRKTKEPYPELVRKMIQYSVQHGLLIENAGTWGNVIRFLCPLVVTDAQLDAGLRIMEDALADSLS